MVANFDKKLQLVRDGYNRLAKTYLLERQNLRTKKYVRMLAEQLPKKGVVLDVGCGAGVPVDDYLIKRGFGVIGIDVAEKQIELARKNVRGGDYEVRDMLSLKKNEYQVDGVVCLYTMFHIPRERQAEVLGVLASFLRRGGVLLVTTGDVEFEGEHMMLGVKMWSSQWGREKNVQMVKRAGFEILLDELNTTGSERHQVILARKVG